MRGPDRSSPWSPRRPSTWEMSYPPAPRSCCSTHCCRHLRRRSPPARAPPRRPPRSRRMFAYFSLLHTSWVASTYVWAAKTPLPAATHGAAYQSKLTQYELFPYADACVVELVEHAVDVTAEVDSGAEEVRLFLIQERRPRCESHHLPVERR